MKLLPSKQEPHSNELAARSTGVWGIHSPMKRYVATPLKEDDYEYDSSPRGFREGDQKIVNDEGSKQYNGKTIVRIVDCQ